MKKELFNCKNKKMADFLMKKGCILFESKNGVYIFEKNDNLEDLQKEYEKLFAMCLF